MFIVGLIWILHIKCTSMSFIVYFYVCNKIKKYIILRYVVYRDIHFSYVQNVEYIYPLCVDIARSCVGPFVWLHINHSYP